jgi:hypothetical protein
MVQIYNFTNSQKDLLKAIFGKIRENPYTEYLEFKFS